MSHVYPLKCRLTDAAGVTRVDVYDDIGEGGWFSDGLSAKAFAGQLSGVKGALEVHINSAGGDVFDGIAIGNAIRGHKGQVTTVVDGLAASIASVIAQAGQERVIQPGAMFMIHDAFGVCQGNAADMAKMAADLDKVSDDIAGIYAGHSSRSTADWRAAMKEETWYDAEEAVAAGLADRVGDQDAELPAGLDLAAAFTAVPGRIAARLKAMPVAALPQDAARHDPMKGTHTHPHPAYGSQGGDSLHSHDHAHDGDASHAHDHASSEPDDGATQDSAGAQDCPTCKGTGKIMEGNRECPDCGGTGKKAAAKADALTAAEIRGIFREEFAAAAGKPGTHGDHERFDPDGDGDCDACPEGDTDHDYWSADGTQLKSVPGKPMGDSLNEAIRAVLAAEGLVPGTDGFFRPANADGVDNSTWDASKAWHNGAESDDPAAFYGGICAGKKAGDKTTQAAWALPYKYHPGDPPNAAGVKAALKSRLPQTQGLTNEAEAKATLQGLMKKINPDYEPDDHAGDLPAGHDENDLSGIDLEEIRSALRGAFA